MVAVFNILEASFVFISNSIFHFQPQPQNAKPPKQDAVLKFLTQNQVFYVSKRALRMGTACNKGLK